MSTNNTNNKTNTDQDNARQKDLMKIIQSCKTLPQSNINGKRKEIFYLVSSNDKKDKN